MAIKTYKIKPHGKPNKDNANQVSNPKTPQEKVQALADLIETRVKGVIIQQYAERGLMVDAMKYALGTDGNDLETYDKQLENKFQGMNAKSETKQPVDKATAPELKKISTEKGVEIKVPGDGGSNKSRKNNKK